jgi:hypothetical protein
MRKRTAGGRPPAAFVLCHPYDAGGVGSPVVLATGLLRKVKNATTIGITMKINPRHSRT